MDMADIVAARASANIIRVCLKDMRWMKNNNYPPDMIVRLRDEVHRSFHRLAEELGYEQPKRK